MGWFAAWAQSPSRFLLLGAIFVLAVSASATIGYVANDWPLNDAIYMVILTVFTVGFSEVRPVDTMQLRLITEALTITGCTGMIFLSGALVQTITLSQVQFVFGQKRMTKQIDELRGHVIICGFGRIGIMLAKELQAAKADLLVIEPNAERFNQARNMGLLCLQADATDEAVLEQAGIHHAQALATVVPSDAVNMFITLSARGLNKDLQIIARGEFPATEKKLLQAGANSVVMPTHIGAEQVASLILFPAIAELVQSPDRRRRMELDLHALGLELEVVLAAEGSLFVGRTVEEIESTAKSAFFVVAVEPVGSKKVERPEPNMIIQAGDGVTLIGRGGRAALVAKFSAMEKVGGG
jgi:Trk K+ transport system NAD-binding subunit